MKSLTGFRYAQAHGWPAVLRYALAEPRGLVLVCWGWNSPSRAIR
jgi:hypothetical protein